MNDKKRKKERNRTDTGAGLALGRGRAGGRVFFYSCRFSTSPHYLSKRSLAKNTYILVSFSHPSHTRHFKLFQLLHPILAAAPTGLSETVAHDMSSWLHSSTTSPCVSSCVSSACIAAYYSASAPRGHSFAEASYNC